MPSRVPLAVQGQLSAFETFWGAISSPTDTMAAIARSGKMEAGLPALLVFSLLLGLGAAGFAEGARPGYFAGYVMGTVAANVLVWAAGSSITTFLARRMGARRLRRGAVMGLTGAAYAPLVPLYLIMYGLPVPGFVVALFLVWFATIASKGLRTFGLGRWRSLAAVALQVFLLFGVLMM